MSKSARWRSRCSSPSTTWSSNDVTAVTVTTAGVMRALKVAPAVITAQVDTAHGQLNTSVVQVPTGLVVSAGDNQSATVNTAVGTPPCVKAEDAGGSGVANLSVTFTVTGGGGSAGGTDRKSVV